MSWIVPSPAVHVQIGVVPADGQEVGAADDQQPRSVPGAVLGVLLVVDDAQLAAVRGADPQFVAEAHHVLAVARVALRLAHPGQRSERASLSGYLLDQVPDDRRFQHDVAVAEEQHRLVGVGDAEVVRAALVEVMLVGELDDADLVGVRPDLVPQQRRRPAVVDDREVTADGAGRAQQPGQRAGELHPVPPGHDDRQHGAPFCPGWTVRPAGVARTAATTGGWRAWRGPGPPGCAGRAGGRPAGPGRHRTGRSSGWATRSRSVAG